MAEKYEIVDSSAFQERSYGKMVLFFIFSFGFYGLYWIHQVHKQFANGTDAEFNPVGRTAGLLVPFYNLIVIWKLCQMASTIIDDQDGAITFLLYLFVAPVAVYVIQSAINEIAE